MRASAAVAARERDGRTVLETLRSDPPLLLRPTATELQLVGGAAGPLGGDSLQLEVKVGAGASLAIRSVAASMVLPGREPSSLSVQVRVEDGGILHWAPEPLISVHGSTHTQRTIIELAVGARLRWRETLVFGRTGEPPGNLTSIIRVERANRVLTHHELRVGDNGWDGPAVLAGARVAISQLLVGCPAPEPRTVASTSGRAAVLPITEDAAVCSAMAFDYADADRLLAAAVIVTESGR